MAQTLGGATGGLDTTHLETPGAFYRTMAASSCAPVVGVPPVRRSQPLQQASDRAKEQIDASGWRL